jgi:hypothetical protein
MFRVDIVCFFLVFTVNEESHIVLSFATTVLSSTDQGAEAIPMYYRISLHIDESICYQ